MDLDMTAIIIAMGVAILLLTIGVSVVIGYLVRAYIHDVTPQYTDPEMFDENGNPVADSLIAFRFDGDQTLPDDED